MSLQISRDCHERGTRAWSAFFLAVLECKTQGVSDRKIVPCTGESVLPSTKL